MEANREAPVFASTEIRIDASPEEVWKVLVSIEQWPTWNPEIRSAEVEGRPEEGKEFKWKAGPGTIKSTLRVVDRPRTLAWTGKTLGIPAIHVYRLDDDNRATKVFTEESWDGLLARAFRHSLKKKLQDSLDEGLKALKAEVERRAQRQAPPP